MPVDPQIQALLDIGAGVPATNTLSVTQARAQYEGRIRLMAQPASVDSVREQVIRGPGGDPAPAYLPTTRSRLVSASGVLSWQRLRAVQPGYA
jgi:hypothetical protein